MPLKLYIQERGNIMLSESVKAKVLNLVKLKVDEDKYHICEKYGIPNNCDELQLICEQSLSIFLGKKVVFEFKYADDEDEWVRTEVKLLAEGTVIFKYQEINHPEWGYYEKILWKEDGYIEEYDNCPSWKKEYI